MSNGFGHILFMSGDGIAGNAVEYDGGADGADADSENGGIGSYDGGGHGAGDKYGNIFGDGNGDGKRYGFVDGDSGYLELTVGLPSSEGARFRQTVSVAVQLKRMKDFSLQI